MKKILKSEWFWLSFILLLGILLHFYNLTSWQHLTYDQSRDYIILKRLIIDHKFTLVGPTVSIASGFFLPPFYYYSLAPFLYLANFHIVGPDIYTALLGTISIVVFYILAKDFFGSKAALVSTFAYGVNPYLVQTSRHAWNPNTLFLFTIIFFLSFERYFLNNKRYWLLPAGFSLGWAIGLHLTAIVFLPFFVYLLFLEIKNRHFDKVTLGGIFLFLIIFSPLLIFDLRHNFPITKAGAAYLGKTDGKNGQFGLRFVEAVKDVYKMPAVLLSGAFQKENMTVRPSKITSFSRVNLFGSKKFVQNALLISSLILWGFSLVTFFYRKNSSTTLLLLFLFFGFLVRICFPSHLFYFYYYLGVFPLIFLCLAMLVKKTEGKLVSELVIVTTVLVVVFSWTEFGFYQDSKPEKFFVETSKIIASDSQEKGAALANNVGDKSRWEHNGLEYRYFAEAIYHLKPLNWEASDYRAADVLYFIDEGNVPDPLKFGGMEMEAFRPVKIEKVWKLETGQKIYKMTH